VRRALPADGHPPLVASGRTLHGRLTALAQRLARRATRGPSPGPWPGCTPGSSAL
jgi:hypothetical protein